MDTFLWRCCKCRADNLQVVRPDEKLTCPTCGTPAKDDETADQPPTTEK